MKHSPHHAIRIAIAQANMLVGDIEGNCEKIINWSSRALNELGADLVVFPELALTGYPPEDLLYRSSLYTRIDRAINQIARRVETVAVVFGFPEKTQQGIYNSAAVVIEGVIAGIYRKYELPNYSVFDEKRYFIPGTTPCVVDIKGLPIGITICEDAWHSVSLADAANAGAQLILNINASPYHVGKELLREEVIHDRVIECRAPVIYSNQVGGQDELVFDGGSFVMNADCTISTRAQQFEEALLSVDFEMTDLGVKAIPTELAERLSDEQGVYRALMLGVKDYFQKNCFKGAVVGLSGGIDSALTLAIAADALGCENVHAISMPSQYTADMSVEDAKAEAQALGVKFDIIPIEPIYNEFNRHLEPLFPKSEFGVMHENIQARARGTLLMAVSNQSGSIVLSTGNKSEIAVGYCTLYGDMVGGYSVLKDVPKTMVYRLAAYRNSLSPVIPQRVIDRPPSAELAPDQKDEDSLPAYDVLDPILELYIENDLCLEDIVAAGYELETVKRIIKMVNNNEYKRRQSAPGVRVSSRAFGRDRRYPITSGFNKSSSD